MFLPTGFFGFSFPKHTDILKFNSIWIQGHQENYTFPSIISQVFSPSVISHFLSRVNLIAFDDVQSKCVE